jgi:hypothetical protein
MKEFEKFIRQLKLEAVALAILMVVLTYKSSYSLWVLPITFLLFDAGMIGYLKNPKTGALFYNLTHNLTAPTLMIVSGILFDYEAVAVIGFCWTFHIAIDRALGFGLKHKTSFHHTHMGNIGTKKK